MAPGNEGRPLFVGLVRGVYTRLELVEQGENRS